MFGASGLPFYRQLREHLEREAGVQTIAARLTALHEKIISSPVTVIVAAKPEFASALGTALTTALPTETRPLGIVSKPDPVPLANTALHASAQVNHCFSVWAGPTIAEPDAAFVSVLAELLTNEVLHRSIRKKAARTADRPRIPPDLAGLR